MGELLNFPGKNNITPEGPPDPEPITVVNFYTRARHTSQPSPGQLSEVLELAGPPVPEQPRVPPQQSEYTGSLVPYHAPSMIKFWTNLIATARQGAEEGRIGTRRIRRRYQAKLHVISGGPQPPKGAA